MNPAENQPINLELLNIAIAIGRSKITLWEQKLATFEHKAKKERALIEATVKQIWGGSLLIGHPLHDYLTAHKNNTEAESNLMQITLAELKRDLAINEKILKQVESPIQDPGKIRLA